MGEHTDGFTEPEDLKQGSASTIGVCGPLGSSAGGRFFRLPASTVNRCLSWARAASWILMFAVITDELIWKFFSGYVWNFVWDDAFMYVRYADNVISHGTISWNPGGCPTYGPTSLLYLPVVVLARLVFPEYPAFAAFVSSATCGFIFLLLLIMLTEKAIESAGPEKQVMITLLVCSLVMFPGPLALHFATGLDTTFVLAYLMVFILAAMKHERTPSGATAVLMGLLGGLSFFARPDLLVFALVLPVFIFLGNPTPHVRRLTGLALAVTLACIGLQMVLALAYFKSHLPLSFYVKGLRVYGDTVYAEYAAVSWFQMKVYLRAYWPLFIICGVCLLSRIRSPRDGCTGLYDGLLVATIIFFVYYGFFVLQVMPGGARFYFPTLPALVYLACVGSLHIMNSISKSYPTARRKPFTAAAVISTFLALAVGTTVLSERMGMNIARFRSSGFRSHHFDLLGEYMRNDMREGGHRALWKHLDYISALPDDLVIATTEVGRPGALNPGKAIIDLSGLNNTRMAHDGFSGELLLETQRPDVIYLPPSEYTKLIQAIETDPYFRRDYEYFPKELIGSLMGVALRKDCRHYKFLRERFLGSSPKLLGNGP
jgi:hypothetical protein